MRITDNTTVRAGTLEVNWRIGLGAIWFHALEGDLEPDVQAVGNHFPDSTCNAVTLVGEWSAKDLYPISNVRFANSGSTARACRRWAPAWPIRRCSRTWTPAMCARCR
ncbi:hypothetical protein K7G98_08915 [Saccharothrix sp. MB29]|nr:hypothetical protein [Saccharothrix sp. MB29]